LEFGGRRQEAGGRRKDEERRSQKKCFYKYEMLPTVRLFTKHRKHHTLLAMKAYYLDFRQEIIDVDYSRSNLTKIHS
jgi:hypothetical protein